MAVFGTSSMKGSPRGMAGSLGEHYASCFGDPLRFVLMEYPWGEGIDSTRANYDQNVGDTSEVGNYAANGYGLYDMAGNVREWVADWYGPYSSAAVENPTGPTSGDIRALRGGAWLGIEHELRVSDRYGYAPRDTYYGVGFRCALSP